MKTILLNNTPKNWDTLANELKEVQKGCTARTIDIDDIKNIIKEIEKNLYMRRLPKSTWDGLVVYCNPYQDQFAKAYKYIPNGTFFNVTYYGGCWRILSIDRGICSGSPNRKLEYRFTDEQKQKMLDSLIYDDLYF